jgi:hypothetical protein
MDEQWRQVDGQSWVLQGALYRGFVVREAGCESWIGAVIDSRGQWLRRERFARRALACAWCTRQLLLLENEERRVRSEE